LNGNLILFARSVVGDGYGLFGHEFSPCLCKRSADLIPSLCDRSRTVQAWASVMPMIAREGCTQQSRRAGVCPS
jgi:hypothetical protein